MSLCSEFILIYTLKKLPPSIFFSIHKWCKKGAATPSSPSFSSVLVQGWYTYRDRRGGEREETPGKEQQTGERGIDLHTMCGHNVLPIQDEGGKGRRGLHVHLLLVSFSFSNMHELFKSGSELVTRNSFLRTRGLKHQTVTLHVFEVW